MQFWTLHIITDPTTVPTEHYLGGFNGEVEIGPDRMIVTGRLAQAIDNQTFAMLVSTSDAQMVLRHPAPDTREIVLWSFDPRQALMDVRPGGHVRAEGRRCDETHPDAPIGYLWTSRGTGSIENRSARLTFDF